MGKLRLAINSSVVLGVYGIVNIVFNGVTLASSKQLSTTVESLEYDSDILTSSNNVLKIALLNDRAYDANNDGYFDGSEDQTLRAIVSSLSYAPNGVNFTTLLPQVATNYTIPTGPFTGEVLVITENISEWVSFGEDFAITLNIDGIFVSQYISGVKGKVLPNGYWHDLTNGFTDNFDKQHVVFENGEWILLE